MNFLRQHLAGFIAGICLVVTVFAVWIMWQTNTIANDAEIKVNQIIQLINQGQQQAVKK